MSIILTPGYYTLYCTIETTCRIRTAVTQFSSKFARRRCRLAETSDSFALLPYLSTSSCSVRQQPRHKVTIANVAIKPGKTMATTINSHLKVSKPLMSDSVKMFMFRLLQYFASLPREQKEAKQMPKLIPLRAYLLLYQPQNSIFYYCTFPKR